MPFRRSGAVRHARTDHRRGSGASSFRFAESAAGQTLTFLIALAIFVPAFTLLLLFARTGGESDGARVADLDSKARLALDLLVTQEGLVAGGSSAEWEALPEPHTLDRVGLRDPDRLALDYGKLARMAGAELAANPTDGKLNYEEFRDALGIGSRYDFHLRAYPIFRADASNRWGTDDLPDGVRLAYVGDYVPGSWVAALGTAVEASGAAGVEAGTLGGLNVVFNPVLYRPPIVPLGLPEIDGDVYADVKDDWDGLPGTQQYLDTALFGSGRLALYDVLVIGSEVEQNLLDPHKATLLAYVEGGGNVIVLGSAAMTPSWMNGHILEYNAGQNKKYSGPLTTPDDSHAVLTTPNDLNHQSYAFATVKWKLDPREEYTVVVGQPTKDPTDLGVSNDGLYGPGGGGVFVSNLNVYMLPADERSKVLANELVYLFIRSVFLDYGPELDSLSLARSASRVVPIELSSGKLVDAKVILYVWRGA